MNQNRRRYYLPRKVTKALAAAGVSLADLEHFTREEVLDLPEIGHGAVWHLERALGRAFESHAPYWTRRGLPAGLAQTLAAAGIRTVEQLRRLERADLLKIKGLGPKQVERLLNFGRPAPVQRRPPTFLEKVPEARRWVEAGITPGCARRLVAAGITRIAHLEKLTRDDVLAIRGISEATVAKCEKVLGRPLAESVTAYWRARGLAAHTATALHRAGVKTMAQLAALSREDLLSLVGIGEKGLAACERLLGHSLPEKEAR